MTRMMMRRSPLACSVSLVSWALAAALPLACNSPSQATLPGASASASVVASASAPPSAALAARAPMRGHDQGRAGMFFRVAADLPSLTEAQRTTLASLETQLQGAASPKDELKTVQTDVVAGIRANKIDTAKLQTDYAAVDKAMQAHASAEADAINGLHAALDPAQRTALAATIRTRQATHDAQRDAHGGMDAGMAGWASRRLARLSRQLDLDAGQQKAVTALIAKEPMNPQAMQAHGDEGKKKMDGMLTSFEGDSFDAKKVETDPTSEKSPHEMMQKDVTFLAQLLPILTPEQREKLAAQREHAGLGMGRRPGGDESGRGDGRVEGAEGAGTE